MEENLHPAVVRKINEDTDEKLLGFLKKRGYWCPRCDILAPPKSKETSQKGKDGFCETCQRNPLDLDEEAA